MRRIDGVSRIRTAAAPEVTNAIFRKRLTSAVSDPDWKKPATQPAAKLPRAIEANQTPIMNPTMRAGASLVTVESPTGERHSSPTVWRRYTAVSHSGLTRPPAVREEA